MPGFSIVAFRVVRARPSRVAAVLTTPLLSRRPLFMRQLILGGVFRRTEIRPPHPPGRQVFAAVSDGLVPAEFQQLTGAPQFTGMNPAKHEVNPVPGGLAS